MLKNEIFIISIQTDKEYYKMDILCDSLINSLIVDYKKEFYIRKRVEYLIEKHKVYDQRFKDDIFSVFFGGLYTNIDKKILYGCIEFVIKNSKTEVQN